MSFCPKLRSVNQAILSLPTYQPLSEIISLQDIEITKPTKDKKIIAFTVFRQFCKQIVRYSLEFKLQSTEEDLMNLLYLVKYTKKELYDKKPLMFSIYNDFFREKYFFESIKKTKEDTLKGGVYSVENATISNRNCFIIGGWVFGIYDKNDLTSRNIISNTWDENISCLALVGNDELITGYKSGNIKVWKIISFSIVKFVDCVFKHFNEIKKIYSFKDGSRRYGIVDESKIEIWREWNKSEFNYEAEGSKIVCSTYDYDEKSKTSRIIFADTKSYIIFLKFRESDSSPEVKRVYNENDKQILSLKYYHKKNALFAGNTILVQIWRYSGDIDGEYVLDRAHFLNDEILFLEYFEDEGMIYLFCGGKKTLHILQLK